jgi:hypothetical protein
MVRERRSLIAPLARSSKFFGVASRGSSSRAARPQQNKTNRVNGSRTKRDVARHEMLPERDQAMDTTTLLIIVIVILLLGGGGFYGRGRWW